MMLIIFNKNRSKKKINDNFSNKFRSINIEIKIILQLNFKTIYN